MDEASQKIPKLKSAIVFEKVFVQCLLVSLLHTVLESDESNVFHDSHSSWRCFSLLNRHECYDYIVIERCSDVAVMLYDINIVALQFSEWEDQFEKAKIFLE